MLVIAASVAVGAALSLLACFLLWRWRKKVVPSASWQQMVTGYTAMEEALNSATSSEHHVRVGYEEVANRLAAAGAENQAMQQQLLHLESNLDGAASDASLLVEGLRDREERWHQAEELRGELEFTVSQLQEAKGLLEENLQATKYELGETRAALDHSNRISRHAADLEARLAEATDRERSHATRLARLEGRHQRTADQLRLVSQRAEHAEQELQDRNRIGSLIGAIGGTAQGGTAWWEADAVPATFGAFASPLVESAEADPVIDLSEPVIRAQAGDPNRRAFERGRNMNDRLQRSYGRLPAVDESD